MVPIQERWRCKDEAIANVSARARALGALEDGNFSTVRPLLRGEVTRGRCMDVAFVDIQRDLLVFHRWRLLWAARLHFPEVVHVCEARGLFSLIRHLSTSAAHVGVETLILGLHACGVGYR